MQLEDLLKQMAGTETKPLEGFDPEKLANFHAKTHHPDAALFAEEAAPGEENWRPSDKALARVAALIGPKWSLSLSLKAALLKVIEYSGEWVTPTAYAVRNAAQGMAASPEPSMAHTFTQILPPYKAVLGLEAEEEDGVFNLSLTLESDEKSDTPIRITVWDGNKRRAVQSGRGSAFVPGLRIGHYRVQVEAAGQAIGDIDLEVNGG